MKILVIGLGQIGLGLLVPVFTEAGYEVVGTDADPNRLGKLSQCYCLDTPQTISARKITIVSTDKASNDYDFIVTAVGRKNLESVASWLKSKNISAPVMLAENMPDPINIFPKQIPIVVDRICPRIEMDGDYIVAIAEDYHKIVTLDCSLTRQLGAVDGVELEKSEEAVELKRKQKMFTVNTAHVIAALYGQRAGCVFVEEAAANESVALKIKSAMLEVAPWLNLDSSQINLRIASIIKRFLCPLRDPISRIIGNRESALRYVDIPLQGLRLLKKEAPTLEETRELLTS